MLKISVDAQPSAQVFKLEGRLAGPWVAALADAYESARQQRPGAAAVIDLADVSFIDRAGQDLLTVMCQAGARLVGTGCLTASLVESISKRARMGAG